MSWVLTFPCGPGAMTLVVSDAGDTPTFATFEEALAAGHRHRIRSPLPLRVPAGQEFRLTSPRPYGPSMRFEAAERESNRAVARVGRGEARG